MKPGDMTDNEWRDVLEAIYRGVYDAIRSLDDLSEAGGMGGFGIVGAVKVATYAAMLDRDKAT